MTTKVLTQQEIQICTNWVKYFASKEGYTDCDHNADLIHNYIDNACHGVYSYNNLTRGMEHYRSNLVGLGLAATREQQQEIARKQAAEEAKKRGDEINAIVANYIKMYCPTGLIVDGDFFPTTQDRIVAFVKNKYSDKPLTNEILSEAISTLWNSLDWFDKSPEATVFRNIPKPVRVLSQTAKEEAGLVTKTDPRNHASDGKFTDPNIKLREMLKKAVGKEGPDQIAAEKISVNTFNRLDHGATASIRKIFVRDRKGGIDWSQTLKARIDAASDYERLRNRRGKYEK